MSTVTLEVPESQLVQWVQQLPPSVKQSVLRALISGLDDLESLVDYGSERIRELCTQRGIDWDRLGEDERQRLIDDLLHEA